MFCDFGVVRAVDVSKAAVVIEIRHPVHAIGAPRARRLPTRSLQREDMFKCVGILPHGPNSHSQGDWFTTCVPEQYTIFPTPGSILGEPRLQHRSDNVANRYSALPHVVMFWIAYRNPPEPLSRANPMWELANCDSDGLERTSLVRS